MAQLVGILNVTPDSFSDGGQFLDPQKAIAQAKKLFADGASIVDIGAESTNPKSTPLTHNDEWSRLEPILTVLLPLFPDRISLDSYHPETIQKAFAIHPVIINDITGMNNPEMIEIVLTQNARCIVSHLRGTNPQAVHSQKLLDDINVVKNELLVKEKLLIDGGLDPSKIILDPGIGFGKTPELNRQLLEFAKLVPDKLVMIGHSRKRFLGEHRMELAPNLEAGKIAAQSGAAYLRVHVVKGHAPLIS